MSYVAAPRARGLFGYSDLPSNSDSIPSAQDYKKQADAAVSSAVDQAKAQAIAYAKQQLENYPPAAEVIAEYNKYKQYFDWIPGFKVSDLKDPKKVEALMQKALIAYARDNGVPTNQKELEQYALKVATSELGVQIPADWPTNVKDLKAAAVNLAATAFVMETGLDTSALTVTADALMDGKLSPSECQAIGGVAGAIAGAVICQAFGIPAPIGAFIGGLIGKDIGGTIGQIFGAGPSGAEEIRSRINAQSTWAKATVAEANALCSTARTSYWQAFDQLLLSTELQWELAEIAIGWKFNLRWFGVETYTPLGQPFSHAWDASAKRFTGAEIQTNRAQVIGHQVQASTYYDATQGKDVTVRSNVYNYGCPVDFGCPYPVVPGLAMPPGLERDAQAFLARGAIWLPESQRNYQCSYPVPSGLDLLDSATKQNWLNSMATALGQEQAAVKALQILSVAVVGDLVKTAATVGAEKKINDILKASQQTLNSAELARAAVYTHAERTGKNLSDLLNYGVFALGVGLVGAALWKKRKS